MKVIVDATFENIEDSGFCLKSTMLIREVVFTFQFSYMKMNYFPDMKEFELLYALLLMHSSKEGIISGVLSILDVIFGNPKFLEISEEAFVSFFESDATDVIQAVLEKENSHNVESTCDRLIPNIQKSSNLFIFFR